MAMPQWVSMPATYQDSFSSQQQDLQERLRRLDEVVDNVMNQQSPTAPSHPPMQPSFVGQMPTIALQGAWAAGFQQAHQNGGNMPEAAILPPHYALWPPGIVPPFPGVSLASPLAPSPGVEAGIGWPSMQNLAGDFQRNFQRDFQADLTAIATVYVSIDGLHDSWGTFTEDDLLKVFSRYGEVRAVHIHAGVFAEVIFQDSAEAEAAAAALDGRAMPSIEETAKLRVKLADGLRIARKEDLLRRLAALEANQMHSKDEERDLSTIGRESQDLSSGGLPSCVVCHDAPRSVVFEPCKHMVCCAKCAGLDGHDFDLSHCPICRANILRRLEVFVS